MSQAHWLKKTERGIQYAIDGVGLVFGTTTNAEIQDRIIQQEIAKGKDLAELGSPGLIPLEKMSDANIAAALALIEAAKAQTEAANAGWQVVAGKAAPDNQWFTRLIQPMTITIIRLNMV